MFEKNKSLISVAAAFVVALVWALFDIGGHMSAAIGWKGTYTYFHIIHGLDVIVWGALLCMFQRMSFSECVGVAMIGVAIIVVPDAIVSFMERGRTFSLSTYKETLAQMITLTVLGGFVLAWLNDYLSEIDKRQEAPVHTE